MDQVKRCDSLKHSNEHGDVYFYFTIYRLLIWEIILKNYSKGKKDKAKSVHSRMQIMTLKGTTRGTFWVDAI